jgi:hypothetical protein
VDVTIRGYPSQQLNTPPRYYHCRAILPATLQFKCGLHDHYLIDGLSAPGFPTCLRGPSAQDSDGAMNTAHFNSLSVDELWIFHQEVAAKLTQKCWCKKHIWRKGFTGLDWPMRPHGSIVSAAVHTRPSVPNIAIRRTQRRHGRVAAGYLDGCGRSFEAAEIWTIS